MIKSDLPMVIDITAMPTTDSYLSFSMYYVHVEIIPIYMYVMLVMNRTTAAAAESAIFSFTVDHDDRSRPEI